jgi:hypothetical protein
MILVVQFKGVYTVNATFQSKPFPQQNAHRQTMHDKKERYIHAAKQRITNTASPMPLMFARNFHQALKPARDPPTPCKEADRTQGAPNALIPL